MKTKLFLIIAVLSLCGCSSNKTPAEQVNDIAFIRSQFKEPVVVYLHPTNGTYLVRVLNELHIMDVTAYRYGKSLASYGPYIEVK